MNALAIICFVQFSYTVWETNVSFVSSGVKGRKHNNDIQVETSRSLKQRTQCALLISPAATGTYHSHIILLAVCRVGAGDALCGDRTTMLGGHGVHSSPEAKQTGL